MEKKRLIITVDSGVHKDLKVFAAQTDTSMNQIINKALAAYDYEAEQKNS